MGQLLDTIHSPADLRKIPIERLAQLSREMRERIIDTVHQTGGHLGSALGVIEITIALHYVFDFAVDRLVFDTGHQCYPHKLLTGRRDRFHTLRQKDGIYGFPNNQESPYDHFTTGHAGNSIASALGLRVGADLNQEKRHAVAVIGDAAIQSGVAFEAINSAGALEKNLLVILNDNEWSIAKSVGALAKYFSRLRTDPMFTQGKKELHKFLNSIPVVGERVDKKVDQLADLARQAIIPGHVFEAMGARYFGPLDGHDLASLIEILQRMKKMEGVILLHLLTSKGKGGQGADEDPQRLHGVSPKQKVTVRKVEEGEVIAESENPPAKKAKAWTEAFSESMLRLGAKERRICAITAGMPDGTGLNAFAAKFPKRFFDVGICEQHGVAFAAGLAREGLRPVVAIYSTFLQRAYDQVFQETLLSNHPAIFVLDRAGFVGEDGPTHHGLFDIAYLRTMPNIVLLSPRDATELEKMLQWAAGQNQPVAIRYPRAAVPDPEISGKRTPIERGKAEILCEGRDGAVLAYGPMVQNALEAAQKLSSRGIDLTVVNARFAKPLDEELIGRLLRDQRRIYTVEDHSISGGFGSAVLELASRLGYETPVRLYGAPDRFIFQAPRQEQLREAGLDPASLARSWEESLATESIR